MRLLVPLAAAMTAGLPAFAQTSPFDGAWGLSDVPYCISGEYSTCPALRIENGVFMGEESRCDMAGAGPVPGMSAALYDIRCQGEGETWAFRAILLRDSAGHLNVLTDDGAMIYWPLQGDGGASAAPPPPAVSK